MATLIVHQNGRRIAYHDSQAHECGYDNVRHMARALFSGCKMQIVEHDNARLEALKNMSTGKSGRVHRHGYA